MKAIVLTGTYNSKNKGDAAMQLSAAQSFGKLFPDAKITVHTPFPDIDGPFYPDLNIVRCTRRRLIYGTLQVLRAWIYRLIGLCGNEEIRCLAEADAVVDLSGDMQTESYGVHVAYSHFLPLFLALALKRPLMLCAQSIGPFKLSLPLARFLFNRIDLITVRDEISLAYLRDKRLGRNVQLTADMAFLLDPAGEDRVREIVEAEGLPAGGEGGSRLLGVSVSGLIEQHFKRRNPGASGRSFAELMAAEMDEVVEKLDVDLVFVPHVTGPTAVKDDRLAAKRVVEKMRHADRAYQIRGDYRPDELKGVIRTFWLHTGARMHAAIGAVTNNVPVAAIAYSHKTPGVMRQFGLEEQVVDIAEFKRGDLVKALTDLAENREAISLGMAEGIAALKAKTMKNIDLCVADLAAKGRG